MEYTGKPCGNHRNTVENHTQIIENLIIHKKTIGYTPRSAIKEKFRQLPQSHPGEAECKEIHRKTIGYRPRSAINEKFRYSRRANQEKVRKYIGKP